ncbi:MAG TPA: hypothetical protein VI076_14645 [Actinopolymorphaceae bacterium]
MGEREGWDFSRVRMEREPAPWEYADVARRFVRPTDRVLDIGGGERFIALADAYATGVGVDHDPAMIRP